MNYTFIVTMLATLSIANANNCHNITGTCMENSFLCISGEIVPSNQRCNGIEDCSDGTDEFLCEYDGTVPFHERSESERFQYVQATCVNCNCAVTAYTVNQAHGWWNYAIVSPTDIALMTGAGIAGGKPCNTRCVTSITMGFYKKNRVCRGWLCCARQRQCITCSSSGSCSSTTPGNRCN